MITKEDVCRCSCVDEVFGLFHAVLYRINESRKMEAKEPIVILDREIGKAVTQMLRDFDCDYMWK